MTEINTFLYNANTNRNKFVSEIYLKEDFKMVDQKKPIYVGVDEICEDWGCSRSKAYSIIKQLSEQLKAENPKVLTISGKINRIYYEEVCLRR